MQSVAIDASTRATNVHNGNRGRATGGVASSKMTIANKPAPLNPKIADKLLDLLSTDDGFRERFAADPSIALAEVGHALPEGVTPICMSTELLATKEEIAAVREQLKSHLMSASAYFVPHCMEAGKITSALRRK